MESRTREESWDQIDRRGFMAAGAAAATGLAAAAKVGRPDRGEEAGPPGVDRSSVDAPAPATAVTSVAPRAILAQSAPSTGDQVCRIVDLVGRRHITTFLRLDHVDARTGYVHDVLNPQLKFRLRGNPQVGGALGLLGPATHFGGGSDYLEEVPVQFAYESNTDSRLDAGSKVFAQRIEPSSLRLGMGAMRLRRTGGLGSATLRMTLRNDANGVPGAVRATSAALPCADIATFNQWRGFSFSTPFDLVRTVGERHPNPGNSLRYFWLCLEYDSSSGVNGSNYVSVSRGTASAYGNPRAEFTGSWHAVHGEHFAFAVLSDHLRLPTGGDMSAIVIVRLDPFDNSAKLDSNVVIAQKGPERMAFEFTYFRGNNFHLDLDGGRRTTAVPVYDAEWHVLGLTHEAAATKTVGYVDGLARVSPEKPSGTGLPVQGWLTSIGGAAYFLDPGRVSNPLVGDIEAIIVTDNALTDDQQAQIAAIAHCG